MKTLFLFLILLVTGSVWAEWVLVAEGNTSSYYLDPSTIRKDGDLRKVWAVISLDERGKEGELSLRTRNEFDCREERYRVLALSYHTETMGTGLMIHNFNQSSKWMDVAPRTLDEKALKFVCSK